MFDVRGRAVLVTGSTQGIGLEIARAFLDGGATVWIHGSQEEKTRRVAQQLGIRAYPVWGDLAAENIAEDLYSNIGDIDILILNASVQIRKSWWGITSEEFSRQMNINLRSSIALIQKFTPYMVEQQWGRVITIGSVQQFIPHKDMAVYAASKSALYAFVRNIAKQLAPEGVTVNNVAPGAMLTPRNEGVLEDLCYRDKVLSAIPAGFIGSAADCNGICILLASEEGRYITGANICVDGGMSL